MSGTLPWKPPEHQARQVKLIIQRMAEPQHRRTGLVVLHCQLAGLQAGHHLLRHAAEEAAAERILGQQQRGRVVLGVEAALGARSRPISATIIDLSSPIRSTQAMVGCMVAIHAIITAHACSACQWHPALIGERPPPAHVTHTCLPYKENHVLHSGCRHMSSPGSCLPGGDRNAHAPREQGAVAARHRDGQRLKAQACAVELRSPDHWQVGNPKRRW